MPDGATKAADVQGIAGDRLKSFIERAERVIEDQAALGTDLKEIFADAKSEGFDPKIMRKVIAIRAKDKAELDEEMTITDLYLTSLGMLPLFGGPLAEARKAADWLKRNGATVEFPKAPAE